MSLSYKLSKAIEDVILLLRYELPSDLGSKEREDSFQAALRRLERAYEEEE